MYICIGCKKEETEENVIKMGLSGNGENTFSCNECTGGDFSNSSYDKDNIKHILQHWITSYQTWIIKLDEDFEHADIDQHQYEIKVTEDNLNNKTPEQLFKPEMGIFEGDLESFELDMKSKQVLELKQDLMMENIKYLRSKVAWHKNEIED